MPTDRDLFQSALDLTDPAARAAYLDARTTDPIQRERVAKLLSAQAAASGFLEDAAATGTYRDHAATADPAAAPTAGFAGKGEHVGAILGGKYKLIDAIGEGGMGSVYMAQQTEPVKRAVAIKVVKAGMDSKAVRRGSRPSGRHWR